MSQFDNSYFRGMTIPSDHEARVAERSAERLEREVRSQFEAHVPAVWTRLVTALAAVVLGLAGLSLVVSGADWWFHGGEPVTVSEVVCDDDYEYRESDGTEIEHFRSETGAQCVRKTYTKESAAAAGWPLWLSFPAWVVFIVVFIAGGAGALVLTIAGAAWPFTAGFTETARELRISWELYQRSKPKKDEVKET